MNRFDHAIIAVRDLNEAIEQYQTLGFDVHFAGRHPGIGTYNALILFGSVFLELLSIYDEHESKANVTSGNILRDLITKHEGGLIGYYLSTTNIQQETERVRHSHLTALGPLTLQRKQPDGQLLTWDVLIPYGTARSQPWPFFIQRDLPNEQLISWEKGGIHLNGVTGCKAIAIAVRDLERVVDFYQHQLGLEQVRRDTVPVLASRRVTFRVGSFEI